ncbi:MULTISPECIES: hypothetical protein [Cryobacterium]|uniref:Thioredoxin-like fold domain-containing protein n=1 Tax=Cryobacterium breve TaxID=1259258 RepID=A0ABY2IZJ3_9MICO|nr:MULTISPECIES: hypothetical protein [Cryobacterium]TFC93094.1 hypothetical protein E3T20_10745 [Cryobacterium sp. TmT3-12]TFC96079.1 hypothetical protein E3O65_13615 [Cryobacterium breve]
MFCIAAFIVLIFMAAVSARYRRYLRTAWNCTLRRVTFRPCDTTFKQDIKDHLLAPLAVRSPKLVGPASVALEVVALLVILTTVWSAYVVVKSGVNLYVYGTCNKQDSASCSLGAEACSIPDQTPTFGDSLLSGDVIGAFGNDFASLAETFSAIPSRMQNWEAEEYLPANASYLSTFDAQRGTALEVIDPGCTYCLQLFNNIEESGFDDRMNLTYIAYPIASDDGYKFENSLLVTQYLEALRLNPREGAKTPVDWEILRRIYTEDNDKGVSWQSVINGAEPDVATALLQDWSAEFGLTAEQVATVASVAASDEVADIIAANTRLVEESIHTVKIPSIIFDGRRHDGLVSVDDLR